MNTNNLVKIRNDYSKKTTSIRFKNTKDYKMYTPEIIQKYKDCFKKVLKFTNDKTKTKFIMYNKVLKWYQNEETININMEKIFIKSKLGSFTSGGCGIGASFFAGLIASSLYSNVDDYLKKLNPFFFVIYSVIILCFGIKILYNEDKKVEMYNMFLEALNSLDYDKNEK